MKDMKMRTALLNNISGYEDDIRKIFIEIGKANGEEYSREYVSNQISKLKENLNRNNCFLFGELYQNQMIGLLWSYFYNGNNMHISFLGVKKEFRNRGIGKRLLQMCEDKFIDVTYFELYVQKNNNAVNFYERNGFVVEKCIEEKYLMIHENIKTPYFEIDEQEFVMNIRNLQDALKRYFHNYIIGYSFKTNSLPYICRIMRNEKCYAEVVSFDEYNLAKLVGYKTNEIIYNGLIKDKTTFFDAVENGAVVNIDSNRELEWLEELDRSKTYKIGIRINFDIETLCPGESSCGIEGGRFGFCIHNNSFAEVLKRLQIFPHISIVGIHLHVSSKTRSLNIYRAIAKTAREIIQKYNLSLEYIDIGGGFFGGMPEKPSFDEYAEVIAKELRQVSNFDEITLIVEPGAALIASPISFITSVLDIKETNRNIFIVTDGSRNNIDPLMRKSQYFYEISSDCRNPIENVQVVSGYTCMEDDRLFKLEKFPLLKQNDRIRYKKVGSYTMCLNPLFIKYFPDVYVKNGRKKYCVRKQWTAYQYLENSEVK